MLVFDHLNSSLSTIFDDLFKPFNEQHSHNTRGESRYVSNTLTNWKPWNGAILISKAIAIIYKFYNCNYSKNKNYKNPSTVGRINQDQVTWISCMFSRGLLKNSMFCVLPVFHEREMHLLNLERLLGFFNDNFFILVSKIIMNICTVVIFMIPQRKIANSCWFICLIQTFIENATWCCNKGDWCIVSGWGVRSCIKYF